VVAVNDVLLPKVTPVAAVPPMLTVAPETKPVPVMVMLEPPAVLPVLGVTPVTLMTAAPGFTVICAVALRPAALAVNVIAVAVAMVAGGV
jgi:hypothetical protein